MFVVLTSTITPPWVTGSPELIVLKTRTGGPGSMSTDLPL
jgi:hypothetical protein